MPAASQIAALRRSASWRAGWSWLRSSSSSTAAVRKSLVQSHEVGGEAVVAVPDRGEVLALLNADQLRERDLGEHDVIGERAHEPVVELLLDRSEYLLREDRPVVHPLPCPSLCEQAFARSEEEGGEETKNDEQECWETSARPNPFDVVQRLIAVRLRRKRGRSQRLRSRALDARALRPRDSAASLAMKIDHAFVK